MLAICYDFHPSMNVNELPRGCFVAFFDYFSLHEQLELRIVCKKWRSVVMEMCRKRDSLKLFGTEDNVVSYCRMLVKYCLFDNKTYINDFRLHPVGKDDELIGGEDSLLGKCHFLPSLFPNVTKLTIDYDSLSDIDIPFLLNKWPKLTFLTLCHEDYLPKKVLFAINSHRSIKSLHLVCHDASDDDEDVKFPDVQLSILSQIEQFLFGGYDCNLLHVLRPLGYNIKRLIICEVSVGNSQWKQLFNNKAYLRKTLTHLTLYDTEDGSLSEITAQKELLKLICANLSALTFLDLVQFYQMPIDYMLTQLARLGKLTQLRMYLSSNYHEIPNSLNKIHRLARLESVKELELKPDQHFRLRDFYPIFPNSIPNLESLIFHTKDVQMAQEVARKAQNNFKHISNFLHILPDSRNRPLDFIGRHRRLYKEYMDELNSNPIRNMARDEDIDEFMQDMTENCIIS